MSLAHLLCLDCCKHNLVPGMQPKHLRIQKPEVVAQAFVKENKSQNKLSISEAGTRMFIFLGDCFSAEGHTCQTPFSYFGNAELIYQKITASSVFEYTAAACGIQQIEQLK